VNLSVTSLAKIPACLQELSRVSNAWSFRNGTLCRSRACRGLRLRRV